MAIFSEHERSAIEERLRGLQNPVKLVHFTQELNCDGCADARRMLAELAGLSGKLTLEVHNLHRDHKKAAQYRIEKVPATVVEGAGDSGVRIYGVPRGYEFAVLLEDILLASEGASRLSEESAERLRGLTAPIHLEVLVTPTCPYCPAVARLAHQMAIESGWITADMIAANEFGELVTRYRVRSVPKTVVNQSVSIVGVLPEEDFVEAVLQAASTPAGHTAF